MSSYPQPTALPSTFNALNWLSGTDQLTINEADQRYLKLAGGTETGIVTFNQDLKLNSTGFATTLANGASAARTFTFPDATTTGVGTDATQTLSNKTIVAAGMTGTHTMIGGTRFVGSGSGGASFGSASAPVYGWNRTSNFSDGMYCSSLNSQIDFAVNGNQMFAIAAGTTGAGIRLNTSLSGSAVRPSSSNVLKLAQATDFSGGGATGTNVLITPDAYNGWASGQFGQLQLGDSNHYMQATNGSGIKIASTQGIATEGLLNLNHNNFSQTSSNTTAVPIGGSSSGIITMQSGLNSGVSATFTVTSDNISSLNVVLVSTAQATLPLEAGVAFQAWAGSITNGSFKIQAYNFGGTNATLPAAISFLIC